MGVPQPHRLGNDVRAGGAPGDGILAGDPGRVRRASRPDHAPRDRRAAFLATERCPMRPAPAARTVAATMPSWPFPPDDPYPIYAAMRAEKPVQWSDDIGAWLVLSHAEALAVLRSPEWSADPRKNPELLARLGGDGLAGGLVRKMLLFTD